uniref:NADH-ubiquinone oxidoreductase chain 2 n=1 Tax=Thuridilla gracilis TaxID=483958 RepID=E6Y1H0_9GAST|nr:NADH dehydrogenase subunit 2 [Thuridilla gracilis]
MSSANSLFLVLLILGPVVSLSSSNWMICWSGVELSFLGLIPLLFMSNKYISLTKESAMKYFCIQALGSAVLFYSGLMVFSDLGSMFTNILLILSIFIKLGIFPLHFWVPSVVAGLDWFPLFFILTTQKVAPFAFFTLLISNLSEDFSLLVAALGGITALVGALMGNNQTDLRAMLGCSSVAHSGWLVLGCITGFFWGYFFIYCISLFLVFNFLMNPLSNVETGISIISLSGLPPFLMFLGKWGVLKSSVEMLFPWWIVGTFLLGAFISLVFYLKFSYSFMLNNENALQNKGLKSSYLSFMLINLMGLMFFFFI